MQRIKVSADGRHLVNGDGGAFFWLADTAWELFHRASYDEVSHYLDVRASQGFNVVQAVVLAELDGVRTPNAPGDLPLMGDDPRRPNEAYFAFADRVIEAAASRGMYMAVLPTWGDKVEKRFDWAAGPEIFDEKNAYVYARWLARRWADRPSVIWILGGDRNPGVRECAVWRAMARGILSIDAGALITFHPQPLEGGSSSAWFHQDDWLSFNMLQTGHDRDAPVAGTVSRDYGLTPVKPVLNGEPIYEAHPLGFLPAKGYSTDADIRRDAYLSVFAGACGHTYGCHSVWQWHGPGRTGVNHPIIDWKEALHLAGAQQMKYLYRLVMDMGSSRTGLVMDMGSSRTGPERVGPLQRIPGDDVCMGRGVGAMRARDGSYACVYLATGGGVVVNTDVLTGERWRVCWMNPRDGSRTMAQVCERGAAMEFTAPNSGMGCDWVLIIEAMM